MLDPIPRRSPRVLLPVSSSGASAFPQEGKGSAPAISREHDFPRGSLSRLQIFLYVQGRGRDRGYPLPRRSAQTQSGAFSLDVAPIRIFPTVPATAPGTARLLFGAGIPAQRRPRSGR